MRMTKPREVRTATVLFHLGLLMGLLGIFLDVFWAGFGVTRPSAALAVAYGAAVLGIVLLVEHIAIGRNWARISYLVLYIVGLPLALLFLARHAAQLSPFTLLLIAGLLTANFTGLLLVFQASARPWFHRDRQYRPSRRAGAP